MEHTEEELKRFIDACTTARRIVETMPELPKGIKPRHIHVIDAIVLTEQQKGKVQVSDISRHLNVTMPSVTRLVRELEEQGVLVKYPDRNITSAMSMIIIRNLDSAWKRFPGQI